MRPGNFERPGRFALSTALLACSLAAASFAADVGPSTLGLPALVVPSDNLLTPAKIALGKALFFDKRLSADGRVACASCHDPARTFSDGLTVSRGVGARAGTRNAPSLVNAALQTSQFRDGRRPSLEAQALDPLTNPVEHGLASVAELDRLLSETKTYDALLTAAFPGADHPLASRQAAQALASYERTLLAGGTPFDRFQYGGETAALTPAAQRGLALFRGRAQCASCHLIGPQDAPLTDNDFHALGVGPAGLQARLAQATMRVANADPRELDRLVISDPDIAALGRFVQSHEPKDIGKFRTPALRDVARSAPYMHDGSVATLAAAIDAEIYYRSLESGRPLILTPAERDDLVVFLKEGLAIPGADEMTRDARR